MQNCLKTKKYIYFGVKSEKKSNTEKKIINKYIIIETELENYLLQDIVTLLVFFIQKILDSYRIEIPK